MDKLETGNENVFQMGENGSFRIFHQGLGSEWTASTTTSKPV